MKDLFPFYAIGHFINEPTNRTEFEISLVKRNRSFIVWDVDFDVKGVGVIKTTEICIQDWEEGKIVKERFFA